MSLSSPLDKSRFNFSHKIFFIKIVICLIGSLENFHSPSRIVGHFHTLNRTNFERLERPIDSLQKCFPKCPSLRLLTDLDSTFPINCFFIKIIICQIGSLENFHSPGRIIGHIHTLNRTNFDRLERPTIFLKFDGSFPQLSSLFSRNLSTLLGWNRLCYKYFSLFICHPSFY